MFRHYLTSNAEKALAHQVGSKTKALQQQIDSLQGQLDALLADFVSVVLSDHPDLPALENPHSFVLDVEDGVVVIVGNPALTETPCAPESPPLDSEDKESGSGEQQVEREGAGEE